MNSKAWRKIVYAKWEVKKNVLKYMLATLGSASGLDFRFYVGNLSLKLENEQNERC